MLPRERRMDHRVLSTLTVQRLGHADTESQFVLRLFALTTCAFLAAASLFWLLSRFVGPGGSATGKFVFPLAFVVSTALLILCSAALERSRWWVRRERQIEFRGWMLAALLFGTGFVGVQAFGFWCIVENLQGFRNAGEAQLGATSLVLGAAAMHALHVSVTLMILAYVTLRGRNDRYDHEYSFGVAFCAWCWHALGIAWLFILGAYGVISLFLNLRLPPG
jgi:cytochrome c oxidase subunit 3